MSLSSFISTYKPQLKGKVAIKSPFARRTKLDGTSTPAAPPAQELKPAPEVIEIGDFSERSSTSLDFFDSARHSLNSQDHPLFTDSAPRLSTRLQLQLDLSPDAEPLSDWFSSSFPRPEGSPNARMSRMQNGARKVEPIAEGSEEDDMDLLTEDEALREGMKHISQQDVLASLEAMDASNFMRTAQSTPKKSQPSPLNIPRRYESQDDIAAMNGVAYPISALSSPVSSAVSGTTLARQLMANPYILSYDTQSTRSSRYTSFVGLARSDSTTLPRGDILDHFIVDPEAPPVPSIADHLYVAPKTPRTPVDRDSQPRPLRRRGSTGSIATKLDYDPTSPSTRPNSLILSPTEPLPPIPPLPPASVSSPGFANGLAHPYAIERRHVPPAINLDAAKNGIPHQTRPITDQTSPSASDTASPKQLEDVLDYYSFPSNPGTPPRGYRPMFTPITEESLSQLSPAPPAPYSREKRESQRFALIGARSPSKNNTRKRSLPVGKAASEATTSASNSPLPTIYDRPRSAQLSISSVASSPTHHSNLSLSSVESLNQPLPQPPSLATILTGRQRSGSAPSPIKVVRDPHDRNKYTLAVGDESDASTPTTGGNDLSQAQQTFPESALSNGFSSVTSPAFPTIEGVQAIPKSDIPVSATFPSQSTAPSLAHQVLLARAQTTIRDRHSRQGSFSGGQFQKRSASPLNQSIQESDGEAEVSGSGLVSRELPPPRHPPPAAPKRMLPASPGSNAMQFATASSSSVVASTSSQERLAPPTPPFTIQQGGSSGSVNRPSSMSSLGFPEPSDAISIRSDESGDSGIAKIKSLPPIPISPPESSTSVDSPSGPPRLPRPRIPPSLHLSPNTLQNEMAQLTAVATAAANASTIPKTAPPPENTPEPSSEPRHTAPIMFPSSSQGRESTNTIDAILLASTSLGSPPPYYSVIGAHPPIHSVAGPSQPPQQPQPLASVFPLQGSSSSGTGDALHIPKSSARDSTVPGKSRPRPPGPAGPRRPSAVAGNLPSIGGPRERSGSQGSLNGVAARRPSTSRRMAAATPMSPRFQAPAVKWKGYTLEVAKWTFSSSQLQAIVSRAIRDSALSSSIRLLKLESLDGEIPDELHRLEMHRTDLKAKYKALTRRRTTLFDSLSFHVARSGEEASTFAAKVVDELRELASTLDGIAEDLHQTDEQISQLNSLVQIHSASALSVALRKLNGSLVKQKEENDYLRQQNIALEQERDEAWTQAQQVADEYDSNFSDKDSSKRSSRVSAKRKSSVRLSKAGLRGQSRRQSPRSSVASSVFGGPIYSMPVTTPMTSRSTVGQDTVPPMPPIPKRRPPNVLTVYEPPLRSSGALSANDLTPDTETRAMVQAQEELYSMLGITSPEVNSARMKRSHSIFGLPSAGLSPPPLSARFRTLQRRSSLPGASALVEAHHALDADHHAVLHTFATLPDEL